MKPNLRLIDPDTGEIRADECDKCSERLRLLEQMERELADAERDLRGKRAQIRALKADREREARDHPRRQEITEIWDHWREVCRHKNSTLDAERTFRIAWALERYGQEMTKRMVDGASYDAYVTRRKNGTAKKHDGITLIFRDAEKAEEFANRAPKKERITPNERQHGN